MFEPILDSRKPNWKLRLVCTVLVLSLAMGFVWIWRMTQMPLKSYKGPLHPLSDEEFQLATRLSAHVTYLSETVGERSLSRPGSLQATTDYLRDTLKQAGYAATEHTYSTEGHAVSNIEASLVGSDDSSGPVIVGAHYDSVAGTVGADDNATGVAGVLEIARLLQGSKLRRTVRFVLFVNEEPPYFRTDTMGSLVYARQLRRDRIPVSAMISLEMLGFFSDVPGSQKYPPGLGLFYPGHGDFIGFVGNQESRYLVRQSIRRFRESASFPSEGVAAPADWPGVGWSDHWSFWQQKYPAIMITDTAMFRYPYYHTPLDTANRVDFARMARVVNGVRRVVESLAMEP
jgi:Zn-dependent M28 family amino/carboxypeptidase